MRILIRPTQREDKDDNIHTADTSDCIGSRTAGRKSGLIAARHNHKHDVENFGGMNKRKRVKLSESAGSPPPISTASRMLLSATCTLQNAEGVC